METVIAVVLAGGLGFLLGAGGRTKEKPPVLNRKLEKEAAMEQTRLETIMRNLENYDGTGYGQEEVPWR